MGNKQNFIKKYSIMVVLLIMIAFFGVLRTDAFLTVNNMFTVLRQSSIMGIATIGLLFVMLTGGIDLSIGSMVSFTSVLASAGSSLSGMRRNAGIRSSGRCKDHWTGICGTCTHSGNHICCDYYHRSSRTEYHLYGTSFLCSRKQYRSCQTVRFKYGKNKSPDLCAQWFSGQPCGNDHAGACQLGPAYRRKEYGDGLPDSGCYRRCKPEWRRR